ncbi:MAG: glycosyltransferase [Candidatus Omnitrophota bacterium]
MNVLFILPQIPYPPHSGGRIVTWNTLKRFARECSVSAVCLYHHPSELSALERVKEFCAEAAAFPAYGKWSLPPLAKTLVSAWPYKAHRFFNPDMAGYIQRLQRRRRFDVIHAQNFYTAAYVSGEEECLKIHYKENIEGLLLLQLARYSANPLMKTCAYMEGWRTKRYERLACRKFERILSISPLDCEELKRLDPSLPVFHQRPGVDLEDYPYLDEPEGPPELIFTGTMSYYPNAFGALDFLRFAWPAVRRRIPGVRCSIVGASPPESLKRFDGVDGVRVTGRVERVGDYLRRALIYIVPLQIGGGIRLKILEAMASGRAVVSTPAGCEGLDAKDGEHLFVAESWERFAEAISEAVEDRCKRARLRENARALMEAVYDWDKVIIRQMEEYRLLCSARWAAEASSSPRGS